MFELQKSDLRSRVIERTVLKPDPNRVIMPRRLHAGVDDYFTIPESDVLNRVVYRHGEKTTETFRGEEIRKENFFSVGIPDASRWRLNLKPKSIWDIFIKESVVFVASDQ